jgi:hypothetical protein
MENTMAIAAKVSGSDYTVPPNTQNSGSVNNRGTVTRGGSVASGKLNNVSVARFDTGNVFNSTPIDNSSADEALAAGTFAYNNNRPTAQRYTTLISGVSNSILLSGADVPSLVRSIAKSETIRTRRTTTAIRAGYFNIYTGLFTTPPTAAVDNWWSISANTTSATSTDVAASPTRAVPGRLVYKSSRLNPIVDSYKSES